MRAASILTLIWISICTPLGAGEVEFILLSNDNNTLHRATLPLGTPKPIGALGRSGNFIELIEADAVGLYAFERVANTLFVLNRFDGSVIRSAALDQDLFVTRRGFDLSPDGILYGVLPGMQLRTVNSITGGTTFVASITGAARVEALAFSDNGTLFAAGSIADNSSSETLFTLSTSTGALTQVGPMGSYDIDDLTFGPDGFLYGVDTFDGREAHLLRIDPLTASVVDLGSTGVTTVSGLVAVRQEVKLTVSAEGGFVNLRWPSSTLGFNLEQTQSLNTDDWKPVEATPEIDGDDLVVKIEPWFKRQFFRLAR